MHQLRMNNQDQTGFSLLEVIIAIGILAVGASGLALLLLASVQGTVEAQERSMATLHASELAQLIHSNPATLGHFMFPAEKSTNCQVGYACSGDSWAASHLLRWQQELESNLSQAKGVVCQDSTPLDGDHANHQCDGTGTPVVKIVWQEPPRNQQDQQTLRLVLPLPQP